MGITTRVVWVYMVVVFGLICGALADLRVSNVLGNNMVLQRSVETRIWGWTSPNYKVVVTLSDGEKYQADSDASGAWQATLSPHAAGGPYNITVEDNDNAIKIVNILFGDVWICSGQSNMAFPLSWAFNSTAEIADTVNYPNIRVFNVGDQNVSSTPQAELISYSLPWSVPSASFMGGFSAVCWFHARNLYNTLGVPLGLIGSNWGGTIIEAWSSPNALAKCPERSASVPMIGGPNPNVNSVLWNAMIYPFLPTAIFGVLWYQGEQNTYEPAVYGCREIALIADWRAKFGTEFVFNFVQLAPWSGNENSNVGTDIPDTREAQLQALTLPRVGFATAVDLGDPVSPYNDIHPRYKQQVGKRLATTTLAVAFGANVTWVPPAVMKAALVSGYPNITFSLAIENQGSGLTYINNTCPSNVATSNCSNFEVVLSDGNTYAAVGKIISSTSVEVTLPNPNKLQPKILYYGYSSWPVLTIFRKDDGYPLLPFKLVSAN